MGERETQHRLSRQIGVYGWSTMKRLMELDVLIVGLRAVGIEVAKNVILANPKSVTVWDPFPATAADLGVNFYLSEDDVGRARAKAVADSLQDLNSFVRVSVLEKESLEAADLANFKVVVFADGVLPIERVAELNAAARRLDPPVGTIVADVQGAAGRLFVDFGDAYPVSDKDGERTRSFPVVDVIPSSTGRLTVFCDDSKRLSLEEGDFVVFRDFAEGGMGELNALPPQEVVSVSKAQFEVAVDGRGFSAFRPSSCYVEQAKVPHLVSYKSLVERLVKPVPTDGNPNTRTWITPDLSKSERPGVLHLALRALDAFRAAHGGAAPAVGDEAQVAEVVDHARRLAAAAGPDAQVPTELASEHVAVVASVAHLAGAQLQPLAAFFGGVAAQEVVKHTGMFTPLRQWLVLDALDALPPVLAGASASASSAAAAAAAAPPAPPAMRTRAPLGDRYDHTRVLLGEELLQRVRAQRIFLVGSGALGCEFLKNFALMGVGCGPSGGRVTVTDMDNIEVSNLNRQFLFREKDVGDAKSTTAAAAARRMNPDLVVTAMTVPVGTDTEDTFDEAFWTGVDVVVNALDNTKARLYVDSQCVWYQRPLLESGTLGTKANTQVVVPHLTESYGDSRDPPEESVPMCTLKSFPNLATHCVEWSRGLFFDLFTHPLKDAKTFVENSDAFYKAMGDEQNVHARRARMEETLSVLETARDASFARCVEDAVRIFTRRFDHDIRQLLHNFPKDYVNPETGVPFWSGSKRAPTPETLDVVNNEFHRAFIAHHAALRAANFGVDVPAHFDDASVLAPLVARIHIEPFVAKSVKIKTPEEEAEEAKAGGGGGAAAAAAAADGAAAGGGGAHEEDEEVLARLRARLEAIRVTPGLIARLKIDPAVFEKDDDSNHHIDWITAAANVRCVNYNIKPTERHEVKILAGKIIPAIATTTCAVTGLVGLELLKVIQRKPLDAYRNSFLNLAVNIFAMSEPLPPKKTVSTELDPVLQAPVKAVPNGFSSWDRVVINAGRDLTVTEFIAALAAAHHGVQADMISIGDKILYWPTMYSSHNARASRTITDLARECADVDTSKPGSSNYLVLGVNCTDPEDYTDVAIPRIQYIFRPRA